METCKHGSGGGCRKPNRAICQGADILPHELDRSGDCGYWLVIHSGSRRLGTEIAAYYQKMAFENCPDGTPFEFAYAAGPLKDAYLHDLEIAQHFAELNRQVIASGLVKGMKLDVEDEFSTVHNYIGADRMILWKGACLRKSWRVPNHPHEYAGRLPALYRKEKPGME